MPDPNVDAFEAALRAAPDDPAAWSAYADYLLEAGDPRGEFMRVQLALEDPALDKDQRKALSGREKQLLDAHKAAFVGPRLLDLLEDALDNPRRRTPMSPTAFRRGVLSVLLIRDLGPADGPAAEILRAAGDDTRWVRSLAVECLSSEWGDGTLAGLADAPFVPHLRAFSLGEGPEYTHTDADGAADFLARAVRLEALTLHAHRADTAAVFSAPLPHLRELSVNCCHDYRTAALADNPALANLRSLSFFPHMTEPGDDGAYLTADHLRDIARSPHLESLAHLSLYLSGAGDEGCDVLIDSGLLFRLESLDLSYGTVTAAGAARLADALHSRPHRLRSLTLDENCIAADGRIVLAALIPTGVAVSTAHQHAVGSAEAFFHGDME